MLNVRNRRLRSSVAFILYQQGFLQIAASWRRPFERISYLRSLFTASSHGIFSLETDGTFNEIVEVILIERDMLVLYPSSKTRFATVSLRSHRRKSDE